MFLVSKLLAYKIDFDPAGMHTPPRHDNLTAEALRGKAVVADTRRCAGEIPLQTDCVGGRGHGPDSGDTAFCVGNNLIHASYYDNVGRTLNQTGDTVAVAVDIDQLTAQGDGVVLMRK